jgi:hypothetical protein
MGEETTTEHLRTFATLDALGGKVSKRVEVLMDSVDGASGRVRVAGPAPLGSDDEQVVDGTATGWVDAASLRDWYRPDRVVVPSEDAPAPGLYADTRSRGRVRIADLEGHLGPDGRPAFRAVVASGSTHESTPTLDASLPRDDAVRLVSVSHGESPDGEPADATIETRPVLHLLAPGVYPDHSGDLPGLPARPAVGSVRIRAFVIENGERHEIERVDERAHTVWVLRDGRSVPFSASAFGPDLVRYQAEPA